MFLPSFRFGFVDTIVFLFIIFLVLGALKRRRGPSWGRRSYGGDPYYGSAPQRAEMTQPPFREHRRRHFAPPPPPPPRRETYQNGSDSEESRLYQDINRGLSRMDKRIEALESLLMESIRRD